MNAPAIARDEPPLATPPSDPAPPQPKLAALTMVAPAVEPPPATEPFGLTTKPWFGGTVVEKWNGVAPAISADRAVLARCRETMGDCPQAAQRFLAIVAEGRARSGRARIGVINRAVNAAIQRVSDLKQWGVAEHWSPPLETFITGRGDCEDFAIAKFVALTEAGVAPEDVRLVVVYDRDVNDGHAVAAVRIEGRWIVLDNRWQALVEDTAMARMVPQYVIDDAGVRAYLRLPPGDAAPAAGALAFAD